MEYGISSAQLPSVLVVDDIPDNVRLIAELLEGTCRCRVATSGIKALAIAVAYPQPELILLDVDMPDMNGYEVCRRLKADPATSSIPVIFITALTGEEDETEGFRAGGVDYITKPVSKAVLLARVKAQLTIASSKHYLARKNELLESMVRERSRQLTSIRDVIVLALASLAEARDNETGTHIMRVQHYSQLLAMTLQKYPEHNITDEFIELIFKTSPLHDIGKVGVPDSILFKQGKLSGEEFAAMKRHSLLGGQTLDEVERQLAVPEEFVSMAQAITLHHHERWDGEGYPLGLAGKDIPLAARIVALADAYDALTSPRAYKSPVTLDDARRIIESERGKQFDPDVVGAFLEKEPEFREIRERLADAEAGQGRSVTLQLLMKKGPDAQ